jgi:hypothetical protein
LASSGLTAHAPAENGVQLEQHDGGQGGEDEEF